MDVGYHILLGQAVNIHVRTEECLMRSQQQRLDSLMDHQWKIHNPADCYTFRIQYPKVFTTPEAFDFQPHKGDEVSTFSLGNLSK